MKKVKVLAFAMVVGLLAVGCSGGTETASNGGIPTAEQLEASKAELGTEISDLKFSLNGTVYQFPFTVQSMLDDEWSIDKSVMDELETMPGYTESTLFAIQKKGDSNYGAAKCSVTVENETPSDVSLVQLDLKTLRISKEDGATLIFPQGITWDSTFEEVAAYQSSDDLISDTADALVIVFANEENSKAVNLFFDQETRTLSTVQFY